MPKSFYIVDGHAHIYRAYFAPFRELNSPTGEPTKATYVFTQMLLNLIDQRKPDYLAMVIDSAGDEGVFRKAIYPEYKATRKERPDDFGPQEERILQIVRDAGVPIFFKHGFEADDLIATMAKRLCGQGFETFMVTKDKDLRQVINDCTKMYDVQGDEVIDVAKMEAKLGYTPVEAVEIQTLMGDAIDNIPGIPGVGEKTAAKLVKKYGSADAVLKHLDELTPKMRENFEKYADRLPISRQLVTLKDDVDFEFNAEMCKYVGLNVEGMKPHFVQLGFTNLLKRLGDEGAAAASTARPMPVASAPSFEGGLFGTNTAAPDKTDAGAPATPIVDDLATSANCKYEVVQTDAQFQTFLAELKKQPRFAFDTETDSLEAVTAKLVGMSFSWAPETGYYVPVCGPEGAEVLECERALDALRPILEDQSVKKVGHNLKYDILVMRQHGVNVKGVELDTMIAAFLIDAGRNTYGIDPLAEQLLRFRKITTESIIGKGKNITTMDKVEIARVGCYAAEDADISWRLYDYLAPRLKALPRVQELGNTLEFPLIDVLVEMERNGIAVDPAVLKEQSAVLGERIDILRADIMKEAGVEFNPDSPKQLGDVLFNKLGLKSFKKTKTGQSTDIQVLEKLALEHKVPKLIIDYRSMMKLKNTYLDNLTEYVNPKTGRIHTSFNQIGAATGRLSSSDPNLQNIPIRTDEGRRIRLAFVPGDPTKNVLLTADYSQIELRILAHYTEEPALIRAFEADEDIHRAVAAEVFNVPLEEVTRQQRGSAKTINFGIIYGVTAFGLAQRIEGLNVQQAGELITAYHKRFPGIQAFFKKCVQEAQDNGFVETIRGRRRPIPEITSGVMHLRSYAERAAINSVVQGSAADLIKEAMLRVHRRMQRDKSTSKLLLQVHDELVFETPIGEAESHAATVREEMISSMTLRVPLKVDVGWGKNWQEVK
jgi:DNA polymerase-1